METHTSARFSSRGLLPYLVLLTCTFGLTACSKPQTDSTQASSTDTQITLPNVSTRELIEVPEYQHTQNFTGTVRAGNTTGLAFELAGKLSSLSADSGDRVKKGQVLATLDTSLLEAELKEINASLAQNQADLALAERTLVRSEELNKQSYVSAQQLDELIGQKQSLLAARQRLLASKSATELRLQKSTLIAPFSATLSNRKHNLGEVLPQGSPVFTLVEENNPKAYIGVPVDVARKLQVNQSLPLRVGEQTFDAKIEGISAEVNPVTRTVEMRLSLPRDARVFNGELAYLSYQQTIANSGFWVPVSALTDGVRGRWNIYVLDKRNDGVYVERRDVEILYTDKKQAFLQGALSPGERYVTQGLHKLVAGQKINPVNPVAVR
ncbi:MAG: efflux RND transporter periplasmic adaptor subunit [Shewanella sp.]|nr:efflux RND transporter periplasmic adaptor subunit [Shewanella sp.]MCF1437482.1 efflux RND transporter periplasmic adaptor subunit [Shewanella sp.]MCF1457005.1 efflux RND transporter periplasmic adaptor subunit [Shewanella sp.]